MNLRPGLPFLFLTLFGLAQPPAAQAASRPDLIVKFKPGTPNNLPVQGNVKVDARELGRRGLSYVKLKTHESLQTKLAQIRQDPNVAYAEPNHPRTLRIQPNDPAFVEQWALENRGQVFILPSTVGADMGLTSAWNRTTGSNQVIVAVIDDSVDITHPDLQQNIWTNPGEIPANGIDDDNNGYIDDVNGWDFLNQDNNPSADIGTNEGHGTNVSGVIGAVGNNSLGISGVAWDVKIMPLKFGLDVASEVEAIDYAIQMGAHIINGSWGGATFSQAEFDAVKRLQDAGILLVVAAGNNGLDNDVTPDYPSDLDVTNILSVASSLPDDQLSYFSHYGHTSVDVAAPGSHILTTRSLANAKNREHALYGYTDGTSFSAPHTVGVAALIKSLYPSATVADIKGRIINSVTPIPNLSGRLTTDGRVNAAQALSVSSGPSIVVREAQIKDPLGNQNDLIDANEPVDLVILLENQWLNAANLQATLSTTDPRVTVVSAVSSYPGIGTNEFKEPTTPFSIRLNGDPPPGELVFDLNITATGYQVSRKVRVPFGPFKANRVYQMQIAKDRFDTKQYLHIEIPADVKLVEFRTASEHNVDLNIRFEAPFSSQPEKKPDSWSSQSAANNESISIPNPKPGIYYLLVSTTSNTQNFPYSVQAEIGVKSGIYLETGWNLISLKGEQSAAPQTFFDRSHFSTDKEEAKEAWVWNATDSQWKVYATNHDLAEIERRTGLTLQALKSIRPSDGVWVKINNPTVFRNNVAQTTTTVAQKISLKKGWNQVSAPGTTNTPVTEYFAAQQFSSHSIPYSSVWQWDAATSSWAVYSPLESFADLKKRLQFEAKQLSHTSASTGYLIYLREDVFFEPPL